MSAVYEVKGYVDIRFRIDDIYQCSQGSTPDEIAELVRYNLGCKVGSCEVIDHKFKLEKIS